MGNYNEMGNVNMKTDYTVEGQNPGWMGNSMYAAEYGHLLTEVTGLQIMGLCLSILAVIILFMWAGSLHRSLSKAGPWKPRRGFRSSAPAAEADLSRQNSGIVMGRYVEIMCHASLSFDDPTLTLFLVSRIQIGIEYLILYELRRPGRLSQSMLSMNRLLYRQRSASIAGYRGIVNVIA